MAAVTTTGNFVRAKLRGTCFGQVCENNFVWWYTDATPATIDPIAAASAVTNLMWGAAASGLKAATSNQYTLQTVEVKMGTLFTTLGLQQDYTQVVNEAGTNTASEPSPSWVTLAACRTPDNTVIYSEDPNALPFSRAYYKNGLSGMVEGYFNGNQLASGIKATFDALLDHWLELNVNGNVYDLMIVRGLDTLAGGNAPAWVKAASIFARQAIGSQLSRKY